MLLHSTDSFMKQHETKIIKSFHALTMRCIVVSFVQNEKYGLRPNLATIMHT